MREKYHCPICDKYCYREGMDFSKDYHGIPFRLVCLDCLERIEEDPGYDGVPYSEADENIDDYY